MLQYFATAGYQPRNTNLVSDNSKTPNPAMLRYIASDGRQPRNTNRVSDDLKTSNRPSRQRETESWSSKSRVSSRSSSSRANLGLQALAKSQKRDPSSDTSHESRYGTELRKASQLPPLSDKFKENSCERKDREGTRSYKTNNPEPKVGAFGPGKEDHGIFTRPGANSNGTKAKFAEIRETFADSKAGFVYSKANVTDSDATLIDPQENFPDPFEKFPDPLVHRQAARKASEEGNYAGEDASGVEAMNPEAHLPEFEDQVNESDENRGIPDRDRQDTQSFEDENE